MKTELTATPAVHAAQPLSPALDDAPTLAAQVAELRAALELAVETVKRLGVAHGPFSSYAGTLDVCEAVLARTEKA